MDEIEHIINNIQPRDLEHYSNTDEKKQEIINQIFDTFKVYPKNKKKQKKDITDQLLNYRYVEFDNIRIGDVVRYIDMRYFFDFKLAPEARVIAIDTENRLVLLKLCGRICFINREAFKYKPYWVRENPMFVKSGNNDMLLLTLIDIMNGKHDGKINKGKIKNI